MLAAVCPLILHQVRVGPHFQGTASPVNAREAKSSWPVLKGATLGHLEPVNGGICRKPQRRGNVPRFKETLSLFFLDFAVFFSALKVFHSFAHHNNCMVVTQ